MGRMKEYWYDEWWDRYGVDKPRWHEPTSYAGKSRNGSETYSIARVSADINADFGQGDMADNGGSSTSATVNRLAVNLWDIQDELYDLMLRKHQDYGPTNISNSPGGPLNGLSVRMHDKIARMNNLLDTGVQPENESLRDTFLDLANYAIIGLLVIDGKWDKG